MNDLISRQAAIDRAVSIPMFGRDVKMVAVSEIKNLPPAKPEPHEGEWEQVSAQRYFMSASYFYRCSACGVNNVRNTNYCPHCGTKMTISTK